MASSSLVLPSLSLKTLVLSKTKNPSSLSFPSLSLLTLRRNPISISSSSNRYLSLSSRFLTKVAISSELDQDSGEEEVNYSPDLKIFVGNLPFSVDSAELADLFQQAGTVEMVEVIYDKETGKSRGFAFVTMSSVDEVKAAVQQFNGYEVDGRQLRVNSGPPPPKDDFQSRGSRGGSSFGGRSSFGGGSGSGSSHRVYVGNLSWGVDELALETLFSEQGKVTEAKVVYDRESGRSRGFGFVSYSSAEEVNSAIESLNGVDLNGRAIRVSEAEARPPRREF